MLSSGSYIEELEKKFAKYIGAPYAVAVDNCTNGLFLALTYRGDIKEVSIPSMTFASVINSALQAGKKVKLDDRLTAGHAYPLDKKSKIWDAAHEVKRNTFHGPYEVFSFYPTKNLASAEGGMIATDDSYFVKWAKLMRNNGRDKGGWDYTIHYPGWKMNMTNLQAAIALDQLEELDKNLKKLEHIRNMYNDGLGIERDSTHLYIIGVANRKQFIKKLKEEGIETSVHFKPTHLHPAYKRLPAQNPKAIERLSQRLVSLPFFPSLTHRQIKYIIKKVNQYGKNIT